MELMVSMCSFTHCPLLRIRMEAKELNFYQELNSPKPGEEPLTNRMLKRNLLRQLTDRFSKSSLLSKLTPLQVRKTKTVFISFVLCVTHDIHCLYLCEG